VQFILQLQTHSYVPPDTYGNLLFKLHTFLSKLYQTRNLFYYTHTYVLWSPLPTYLPTYLPHPLSSVFCLPTPNLLYLTPSIYPHLLSLSTLQCKTWTHTKSSSTASNCDLYFMPFCYQHDETSPRLNWPERDDQRLSSPKATVAGSVSQPFSWIQRVGTLASASLWLQHCPIKCFFF